MSMAADIACTTCTKYGNDELVYKLKWLLVRLGDSHKLITYHEQFLGLELTAYLAVVSLLTVLVIPI